MQNIELKKGTAANNLLKAVSTFLETGYHRQASDFEEDMRRLDEARSGALNVGHTSEAVPVLVRYAGQLQHLAAKFPFDDDHIKVVFSWNNFAGKESRPSTCGRGGCCY